MVHVTNQTPGSECNPAVHPAHRVLMQHHLREVQAEHVSLAAGLSFTPGCHSIGYRDGTTLAVINSCFDCVSTAKMTRVKSANPSYLEVHGGLVHRHAADVRGQVHVREGTLGASLAAGGSLLKGARCCCWCCRGGTLMLFACAIFWRTFGRGADVDTVEGSQGGAVVLR
jgi:hypothetical protein